MVGGPGAGLELGGFMTIWRFPEIAVPPNHAYLLGFSTKNHPAIGVPSFMDTT